MSVSPGQYLVVELEPDLHRSRVNGIMLNIKEKLPGVVGVHDLTAISQATLDCILKQPTDALRSADPTAYRAMREYQRRRHQPRLRL